VNHVFSRLIVAAPGSQPAYEPLASHRDDAPGGTRVLVLGEDAHPDTWRADDVREAEADDVASVIRTALSEAWQVFDVRTDQWRTVALD
ncbi:hypothetical protein, partial [Escherichia coli]|uniref:hypothetical protein n=1 Tax=Escherichia coli TaxID=562 RepID=UPI001ADD6E2A